MNERFSDNGELVYEFGDEFLVVCPRCAGKARVFAVETESEKLSEQLFAPRKLVCLSCVYRHEWNGGQIGIGGGFDWYFRLPLWLEISCCGKMLWAYNEKHLGFIEDYVGAKLRERKPFVNKSLASRLPGWIKQAKNRDEILKAIGKLREKLNGKS
ncbi:MAG: hypothetical protein LUM44_07945 [Pyrinomonadaceae bacterium]|nr:hypothetical protein [Pyrinomonadaceae bacterium]